MDDRDRDEEKRLFKEALKEWMDEKWATFGRWSAGAIAAAALTALLYFMLALHGWHRG